MLTQCNNFNTTRTDVPPASPFSISDNVVYVAHVAPPETCQCVASVKCT